MLRRLAAFLASALVAGTLAVSAVAPASAHPVDNACAGSGVATVGGNGLVYPGIDQPIPTPRGPHGFNFSLIGECTASEGMTASGSVSGYCGLSSGSGETTSGGGDAGHDFTFAGVGSMLVITGEVVGAVNATPDALSGSTCTTGATRFLVTGSAVIDG